MFRREMISFIILSRRNSLSRRILGEEKDLLKFKETLRFTQGDDSNILVIGSP